MKMKNRDLSIIITSIMLGILMVVQSRSFTDLTQVVGRDSRANAFREIQILKQTNQNLNDEIGGLETDLSKAQDQDKSVQALKDDIEKYKILTGSVDVSGPGIELKVSGDLKAIWLTDIVNELFSAGAESVSVNGIRLTDTTNGFDTIPNGQVLLSGSILKTPIVFDAIGDKKTLQDALQQPQGILQRMRNSLGSIGVTLEQKDLIEMQKVI